MSKIRKNSGESSTPPQLITTDWAQFSLKGILPDQKKGWRKISPDLNLKYRGYGHHNFSNEVSVVYKGEELGRMDVHPTSLMSPDTVIWYTNNRIQYSAGWTDKLKAAWKELNLAFSHVGRLDIAVDAPDTGQFKFIDKLVRGQIRLVGNVSFNVRYDNNSTPQYFRFGSRSSDKFMRSYYKRQEIEVSNKKYLESIWEKNGFDLEEDQEVCRFEICLKRKELKKYKDIYEQYGDLTASNLELLEDPQYLAALFNTGKKGFFEFVSRRSFARTGNVTRCKRIKILDLSRITTYLLEKIKSKATNAVGSAKIACKLLFILCCKTCEERYLAEVEEIVHNFNLQRWFAKMRERWYNEFEVMYRGENFEFITNYTSRPEFIQSKIFDKGYYKYIRD